jgi:hypothetical protein
MEFIESLFGISPDGGSGILEALYLVLPLLIAGSILFSGRRTSGRDRL